MDIRTEWPWSLEEEAEWKAELTRREQESVEDLMGETVDVLSSSGTIFGISEEESGDGITLEKYSVTT